MKTMYAPFAMAVAGLGSLTAAAPAIAHHSFAAEFDQEKPIKLQGTVTKMEWINPHSWIHLSVKEPNGETADWMIEGGTPNLMLRRGRHGDHRRGLSRARWVEQGERQLHHVHGRPQAVRRRLLAGPGACRGEALGRAR